MGTAGRRRRRREAGQEPSRSRFEEEEVSSFSLSVGETTTTNQSISMTNLQTIRKVTDFSVHCDHCTAAFTPPLTHQSQLVVFLRLEESSSIAA